MDTLHIEFCQLLLGNQRGCQCVVARGRGGRGTPCAQHGPVHPGQLRGPCGPGRASRGGLGPRASGGHRHGSPVLCSATGAVARGTDLRSKGFSDGSRVYCCSARSRPGMDTARPGGGSETGPGVKAAGPRGNQQGAEPPLLRTPSLAGLLRGANGHRTGAWARGGSLRPWVGLGIGTIIAEEALGVHRERVCELQAVGKQDHDAQQYRLPSSQGGERDGQRRERKERVRSESEPWRQRHRDGERDKEIGRAHV